MATEMILSRIKKNSILKNNDLSTEGKLYIVEKHLYKIYNKYSFEREERIDKLLKYNISGNFAWPLDKLFSKNVFLGILLDYYRDYFSFNSILGNNKIAIEDKIKICCQFIEGVKKIHEAGIAHGDLHLGNIITNGKEAIIVDLDSAIFYDDMCFPSFVNSERMQSMKICLSLLYDFDLAEANFSFGSGMPTSVYLQQLGFDSEVQKFVREMEQGISNIYFDDYLEILQPNHVVNQKRKLKLKKIYR